MQVMDSITYDDNHYIKLHVKGKKKKGKYGKK